MTFKSQEDINKRIDEFRKKLDKATPKTLEHGIYDNVVCHLTKFVDGTFTENKQVQWTIDKLQNSLDSYNKEIEDYNAGYEQMLNDMPADQRVNAPEKKKFEKLDKLYKECIKQLKWAAGFK